MIFRLALKELKSNILINLLCLVQITVIFVITVSMVSSVESRFEKYKPFEDILSKKGMFIYADNLYVPIDGKQVVAASEEDISRRMGLFKAKGAIFTTEVWTADDSYSVRGYSSDIIRRYTPEITEGRWISDNTDGTVEGVISENNSGINVGDVIRIDEAFGHGSVNVKIVGRIPDGTRIVGFSSDESNRLSCDSLYEPYSFEVEEKPLLILNTDQLTATGIPFITQIRGSVLMIYSEDITEDEIKHNESILFKSGPIVRSCTLSEMNSNSIKSIYSDVMKLLPMIISIFILTAVSIISVSAVNAKTRIKVYAIYYICGMKWSYSVLIEIMKSAFIIFISGILAAAVCIFAEKVNIMGGLIISGGHWQLLSCFVIGVLFTIISAIYPKIITGKEKPVTIFHSN